MSWRSTASGADRAHPAPVACNPFPSAKPARWDDDRRRAGPGERRAPRPPPRAALGPTDAAHPARAPGHTVAAAHSPVPRTSIATRQMRHRPCRARPRWDSSLWPQQPRHHLADRGGPGPRSLADEGTVHHAAGADGEGSRLAHLANGGGVPGLAMAPPRGDVPLGSQAGRSSAACQRAAEHGDKPGRLVGREGRAPHGSGDEPSRSRLEHSDRHPDSRDPLDTRYNERRDHFPAETDP